MYEMIKMLLNTIYSVHSLKEDSENRYCSSFHHIRRRQKCFYLECLGHLNQTLQLISKYNSSK